MILADEGRTRKITEVKSFDLFGMNSGVEQGVFHSFDGERPQIAAGKSPERRFAYAHQGHGSHIFLKIARTTQERAEFAKRRRNGDEFL